MRDDLASLSTGQGVTIFLTTHNLVEAERLCDVVKYSSLCGLGQSAPNPVLTTLKNFRGEYLERLRPEDADGHDGHPHEGELLDPLAVFPEARP